MSMVASTRTHVLNCLPNGIVTLLAILTLHVVCRLVDDNVFDVRNVQQCFHFFLVFRHSINAAATKRL